MKNIIRLVSMTLTLSCALNAQTILDNFNSGTASGAAINGWVGKVTQNATTITVGSGAMNEQGWRDQNLTLDLSGMSYILITAQRDSGHDNSTTFMVEFTDASLGTQQFTTPTTTFSIGSLTVAQIAIGSWNIDATQITDWTIGGGSTPTQAFRMTIDQLAVSASAIPEPSTYAAFAGLAALGVALYRRRLSEPA